jgi:putative ABC transport system substrate-binding protein
MRRRDFIVLLAGAMGGWHSSLRAQQKAMPVIGWLSIGSPDSSNSAYVDAFWQGLHRTVDANNVAIDYRWAHGQYDLLPALAADLVGREVTAVVAADFPSALAAKAATSTIPIVFLLGIDPVEFGLVSSLNRPGGNMTGVALLSAELAAKRLELLHELLPTVPVVAVLVNPTNPRTERETKSLQDAARSLGLQQLRVLPASKLSEIEAAFGMLGLGAGALVVVTDPFFTNHHELIVTLAARYTVPAIYGWREFATAGGLISYGANLSNGFWQCGVHAGQILKGTKPADLPVQQAVKVELVINMKAARALGLTIPPIILARADEVIE